MIVVPVDGQEGINIVKKAKNEGVPVIAYDRLIKDNDLRFYISFDSQKVGELQAKYAIDELNKGQTGIYKLNPRANLVMINGDIKDPNTKAIEKGWFLRLETFFKNQKLNLMFPSGSGDTEYFIDNWDAEKAAQKVQELLNKYQDDIQIILVANNGMANKIIGVLGEKIGKILITGQDGSAQSARNIVKDYQGITRNNNV